MIDQQEKEKQKQALQNFVLNIDCLEKLSKWKNEVNFFRILKVEDQEIRHSNFLAWILDSNGSHNLGDKVVRKLIQKVIKNNYYNSIISNNFIKFATLDFSSFIVMREWKHFDLFLISEENKVTITIENKIFAKEGMEQTKKYREEIEKSYYNYTNLYIFLTPCGYEAQDNEWCTISYYDIEEIIDNLLKNTSNISEDVKLLLNNYLSILRREVLMDKELHDICIEIYKAHRDALDLIYENRPDNILEISNYIKDYLKQNKDKFKITIEEADCSKSYIRFTTDFIDKYVPSQNDNSYGWKNGKRIMYEIPIYNNYYLDCVASISKPEDENCMRFYEISQKNNKFCGVTKKSKKPNQWARLFKKTLLQKGEIKEGLEEIEEKLHKSLDTLFEKNIPDFEKLMKSNLI